VLVGSRGLAGARASLGSVSDMAVHYAAQPVLVIPYPLLRAEYAAPSAGPVLVGWDGSAGARDAATRLWPDRDMLVVSVDGAAAVPPPADSPSVGPGQVTYLDIDTGRGGPGQAVADALSRCARDRGAAVVVVGSRGRSAAAEIVLGSVAMATLHHAHRPVLVVSGGRRTRRAAGSRAVIGTSGLREVTIGSVARSRRDRR
jgi:nucleotide-binding universal stress UspA family protein